MPIPPGWSQALREFVKGWGKAEQDGRSDDDYIDGVPFDKFVGKSAKIYSNY